jgi:hypothetical protein
MVEQWFFSEGCQSETGKEEERVLVELSQGEGEQSDCSINRVMGVLFK